MSRKLKERALFLYILFLFYLNLTPVIPSTPMSNGDKIAHFAEFYILSFLGKEKVKYLVILPILLEFLQLFIPGRNFSIFDMLANLIGFSAGILVWRWLYEGS